MDVKKQNQQNHQPKKKSDKQIETRHKYWIGGYIFLALVALVAYFLLSLKVSGILGSYLEISKKITLGCFFACIVLIAGRLAEMIAFKHTHIKPVRYNLVRIIRLLTALLIFLVFISLLFQNWYTAAVSLGLISLIVGFALQTPISSFIAWLYIVFRNPYRVGDRIQINQFTGDVVEIGYLDTTLWEFGGGYLSNDIPSGRLIRFPNSLILQAAVFNYSWPKFPYIWNEIPFHIAYESDLSFVEKSLKDVTRNELGQVTAERIRELKELIQQTPIDDLEINEYPFVSFRINPNTWVEVIVTYLVEPKKADATRSRIIKSVITKLLKEPGKVRFPKNNAS
jgi:small-conductance mechanosensitive channel